MPNTFTDQFYIMDPWAPPGTGSTLTSTVLSITDSGATPDNVIDATTADTVNGSSILASYPGDTVTVNVGGTNITYTGITFYLANGTQVFTPIDGQALQSGTLVSTTWVPTQGGVNVANLAPPCFTPGTLIATPDGEVPVEALSVGDLVETLDHGARPIRWIGSRVVPGIENLAPIRIAEGHVGNRRPLLVSPQHRILLCGWKPEMLVGAPEVLVAAKHLVDDGAVRPEPCRAVTYIHLMFEGHEIVFAEGCPCESFDVHGDFASRDAALREELRAIFPELADDPGADRAATSPPTARKVLRGFEAAAIRG